MIRSDSGLPGCLESLYLREPLTARLTDIRILVNPIRLMYQASKVVIINSRDYILSGNRGLGNTIISRVSGYPGTVYVPYLPVCLPGVVWNGKFVESVQEFLESWAYDEDTGTLYVSKIRGYHETGPDLDYIGFLQYQVGYNFYDSPLRDLDILKCREGLKIEKALNT